MLKIADFLFPQELEVQPTHLSSCLFIGSCVAEAYVVYFRKQKPSTHIDFVLFNNVADIGAAPPRPIETYDFSYVQLPARHIIGDIAIDFSKFTDATINENIVTNSFDALELMLDAAMKFNKDTGAITFVQNFVVPQMPVAAGLDNVAGYRDLKYLMERLNHRLGELVARYKNAYLIDAEAIASSMGKRHFLDDTLVFFTHGSFWYPDWVDIERGRIEHVPPLEEISEHKLGEYYAAIWRACEYHYRVVNQVDPVKLVIFDLDDTLWRGLIGEHYNDEGPRPISDGWPLGMHEAIHHLKARGILVAICSKNNPELVAHRWYRAVPLEWIDLDDFVCVEIGWAPKAEAVGRIMSEVGLTPKSVVFVDDNPVERSAVQEAFPAIRVLGSNPFLTRRILLNAAETQIRVLTDESARRDRMVRSQREREAERKTLSREEFLRNLGCRVDLHTITSSRHPNFDRAFELLNKTNQFNTTGRRWTPLEAEQHFERGGTIVAFEARDKFTTYGLVGVVLIAGTEIVQFAMSCRVLGLEIESGVLNRVVEALARKAPSTPVIGTVVATDANFVCRDVFSKSGFVVRDDGRFACTTASLGAAPDHLALNWV